MRIHTRAAILLATYNGMPYLEAQVASLRAQTCQDFTVVVRDDGSNDETRTFLAHTASTWPERLILLPDDGERLGPCLNFARLLHEVEAPFYFFADQDDVWEPTKVERMLQEIEKEDATVPALLHCDLKVMGKDGSIWADSFWAYQKLEPRVMADFNRVLVQNSVTGCAMVCNRALRDLAGDIPPEAVMHDWWLALIAAGLGKLNFLCEPLIRYRQHDANDTGAKQWGGKFIIDRLRQFFADRETMRKSVQRTIRQARAFRQRFAGRLPADKLEILEAYCSLPEQPRLKRWRTVSQYGFWKYGLVRNLAYLLLV